MPFPSPGDLSELVEPRLADSLLEKQFTRVYLGRKQDRSEGFTQLSGKEGVSAGFQANRAVSPMLWKELGS